jgi:hypothetical protein
VGAVREKELGRIIRIYGVVSVLTLVGNQARTMKTMLIRFLLLFSLTSCSIAQSDKRAICNCCDLSYTSIDSALSCSSRNPDNATTADNRLFLFAFVNKDLKKHQDASWNIIKDQDIINVTKRNYLLIILDGNGIVLPKGHKGNELLKTIEIHDETLFFVIANQALYPFADWSEGEKKDIIIDRLRVGAGP